MKKEIERKKRNSVLQLFEKLQNIFSMNDLKFFVYRLQMLNEYSSTVISILETSLCKTSVYVLKLNIA